MGQGQTLGASCQGQLGQLTAALASCNGELGEPCTAGCEGGDFTHGLTQHGSCTAGFAEEELEVANHPGGAPRYWFMNNETGMGTSVSSLYSPGGLVKVHRYESSRRRLPAVTDAYDLNEDPLGRGTYGEVFLGVHRKTGARRAIKAVNKSALRCYLTDAHSLSNFIWREVEILRHLDHPNIIRLYEAYEDSQRLYLVMELCEGGDLLERVAAAQKRMPEADAARLLRQILAALQHIESKGCVHRDIKPENFLFTRREPESEARPPVEFPVKLIDFGLSRRLASEAAPSKCTTPRIGTTRYMAPEANVGKVTVTLADRADMWSLGVVLHVIFTGYFPAPNLTKLLQDSYYARPCWSHLSKEGLDLLRLLLRVQPQERPAVSQVLQHEWFKVAGSPLSAVPSCLSSVTDAVPTFASAAMLRRLALVAAGREADDSDLGELRSIFQMLQMECGSLVQSKHRGSGGITPKALDAVASGQSCLKELAAKLKENFHAIDLDGSGSISWSKLVGVSFSNAQFLSTQDTKLDTASNQLESTSYSCSELQRPEAGKLPLREEVCFRAFDLLSQSSGMVTGLALSKLLLGDESIGGSSLGTTSAKYSLARCDLMLREADVCTGLNAAAFTRLMRGLPAQSSSQRGDDQNGWHVAGPQAKAFDTSSVGPAKPVRPPQVPIPCEIDDHHALADFEELAS